MRWAGPGAKGRGREMKEAGGKKEDFWIGVTRDGDTEGVRGKVGGEGM